LKTSHQLQENKTKDANIAYTNSESSSLGPESGMTMKRIGLDLSARSALVDSTEAEPVTGEPCFGCNERRTTLFTHPLFQSDICKECKVMFLYLRLKSYLS